MIKGLIVTISSMMILGLVQLCSKDEVKPGNTDASLYGEWLWVSSSGGLAGVELTPESEGYMQYLKITEAGDFEIKKKDSLVVNSEFTLVEEESRIQNKSRFMLKFEGDVLMDQSYFVKGRDTLILVEECWDCFTYKYVKK